NRPVRLCSRMISRMKLLGFVASVIRSIVSPHRLVSAQAVGAPGGAAASCASRPQASATLTRGAPRRVTMPVALVTGCSSGIGGGGPIEEVPVDWVKSLFETNYFGVIRMIRAVLPSMRDRRGGAIVNVSSIGGRVAVAGHGHYCAVKHALEAASEALAQEVQG